MIRNFVIFSSCTFCSRILGFIRDFLIATHLGVGMFSDVFFVAFRLPNLFRALLAEGAFSATFIPIYVNMANDLKRRRQFVANICMILAFVLIILCFTMQLLMPYIITIISPGFIHDASKFAYTVFFARVMFPYLFFIAMVAFIGALFNANNHFAVFAVSPIILNICLVLSLVFFSSYFEHSIYALSYGVFIAGVLQLSWMLFNMKIYGVEIGIGTLSLTEDIKVFSNRFFPAVLGMGIAQVSIFVDTIFASVFIGAISYFYYSDRLVQLPLAIIGVALSTVILPQLSASLSVKDISGAISTQNRALKVILFMVTPSAIALHMFAFEFTSCVYFYGALDLESLRNTAKILEIFAFALPAFVLNKVFTSVLFAVEDTKTPAKYSLYSLVLNIVLNFIFVTNYKYCGIAVATVISAWFNFILIIRNLMKSGLYVFEHSIREYIFYVFCANVVMIFIMQLVDVFIYQAFFTKLLMMKLISGSILLGSGLISYFGSFALVKKIFRDKQSWW